LPTIKKEKNSSLAVGTKKEHRRGEGDCDNSADFFFFLQQQQTNGRAAIAAELSFVHKTKMNLLWRYRRSCGRKCGLFYMIAAEC